MANNIQIVGNITDIDIIDRYQSDDIRLIGVGEIQNYFDPSADYIEYFIYDISGTSLLNLDYSYTKFKLPTDSGLTPAVIPAPNPENQITNSDIGVLNSNTPDTGSSFTFIEIDPVKDLQEAGYKSGEFKIQYNFFKNKVGSPDDTFFLKRISADRTEISIASVSKSNEEIETIANSLIDEINSSSYFVNYLVNFGLNTQVITVNVALDKIDAGYEILFKLYDPLPDNIIEKADLWVVEEKVNPYAFNINLDTLISPPAPLMLRGANFNIPISKDINTISTQYSGYNNLFSALQLTQSNTYNKLSNALTSNSIAINVNYTDYNNFSFFGSAEQRLIGFYNKVKDIEDYNNAILNYSSSASFNPYLQLEINRYSSSITDIISNFDGYETYLYFESTSYTWPKSTSTLPYALYSTSSVSASVWYNSAIESASLYDELNPNNLINGIPTYLRDNPDNNQYLIFLNMIGHYFDNIWILLKSVTDINLANNNPVKGISNDLVYQVLKSLGIDLFNSAEGDSLEQYMIGNNTGSFTYSGSLTDFSATSSYLNNIPRKDLTYELYKRIYHNLPLLVKTKGTTAGLQNIITTFGVTSSVLNVKEYGGESKSEYLKGYSKNKVRISDVISTGSVLSSLTTIQQIPTSSNEYLDNDLQFVDISFSPQTQIDLYISNSISSVNPLWDMDDYIGDPRQQYYNNYPDLNAQRKIYFEQGTGSYSGFTSSYLDYNGFIRLIQFFDNSLFKTLESFVPARTSLSTGITINSPMLERNKFAYANPTNSTTESIHEAEIASGSIGTEYGFLYDNLSGDKAAYYSGELSGSGVNLYDTYFIPSNENPYLVGIDIWNSQHDISESISLEKFALSDYNVLFNNVSSSVTSSVRTILENPGLPDIVLEQKTSSISSSAELQDSYLSLTSYKNPRYDGSRIISSRYNEYTDGDSGSYGKTSAIDKYQTYFLTFKEIRGAYPELVNKAAIYVNSLVDKDGNQISVDINTSSLYYYNLIDNFSKDSIVDLTVTQAPAGSKKPTSQTSTIYLPAYFWPSVILTNESGSNDSSGVPFCFTASITLTSYSSNVFQNPFYIRGYNSGITFPAQIGSFAGYFPSSSFYRNNITSSGGTWISGSTTFPAIPGAVSWSYFSMPNDLAPYKPFNLKIGLRVQNNATNDIYIGSELTIRRNRRNGVETFSSSSMSNLFNKNTYVKCASGSAAADTIFNFGDYKLLPGDEIYASYYYITEPNLIPVPLVNVTSPIAIQITTSSLLPVSTTLSPSNIWTTGSSSRNVLTSSVLYPYHNANLIQVVNPGTGGDGGYSPITNEFKIIAGDEIRFNQNETFTYTILYAEESLVTSRLFLYLNRDIDASINLPNVKFLIRRNQFDPSKLIINSNRSVDNSPGYMTPQHITPELVASLDKTVKTLKENGVL